MKLRLVFGASQSTVAVAQKDETDSASSTASVTDGTVTIQVNREQGTAPAGFFFTAIPADWDSGDPTFDPYTDLHYRWFFNDKQVMTRNNDASLPIGQVYPFDRVFARTDDSRFIARGLDLYEDDGRTFIERSTTWVPEDADSYLGVDGSISYGPHCSHASAPDFEGADDFTLVATLEIRRQPSDIEPLLTVTKSVVVDNPDVIFAGTKTICINSGGTVHGDEPAGAQIAATIAGARSLQSGLGQVRFLCRNGEDHTNVRQTLGGWDFTKAFIGSYGPGTPAGIVCSEEPGNPFLRASEEWCHYGVAFKGPYRAYDPYHLTATAPSGIQLRDASFKTLFNLTIDGFYTCASTRGPGSNSNICFQDVYLGNYQNYGLYIHDGIVNFGAKGLWSKQHPQAVVGTAQENTSGPAFTVVHAPLRLNEIGGRFYLGGSDLRSIGSWGGGIFQPSLRLGRNTNNEDRIEEAVIERVRSEGGNVLGTGSFGADPSVPAQYVAPRLPRRYLYDKIIVRSPNYQNNDDFGAWEVKGPTVRNAVLAYADMPTIPKDPADYAILYPGLNRWWLAGGNSGDAVSELDDAFGLHHYNLTMVDMRQPSRQTVDNFFTGYVRPNLEPLTFENCIFAWPKGSAFYDHTSTDHTNRGAGNYLYAPDGTNIAFDLFDLTPIDEPSIDGFWHLSEFNSTGFNTSVAVPDDTSAWMLPLTGNPVIGSADPSGRIAVDDLFGHIRGASPSKGAVEPA